MSITKYPPNTIWLGGPRTEVGDVAASEAITPGMLIQRISVSGVSKFRKHADADIEGTIVATEQSMLNLGVDDDYAAGDLVEATVGSKGTTFWMLIGSGASVLAGARLSSAGNGLLKAGTTKATFVALEDKDNSAGPGNSRLRVEVL